MMLESVVMSLWPQLVALVLIAWLVSKLSEKIAQAEKKIETAFQLINKLTEELYKK